jgi:hypothetical protein
LNVQKWHMGNYVYRSCGIITVMAESEHTVTSAKDPVFLLHL